ncbi:MAG: GTP cyclohydrolase, FolE2/MptA family [Candidatus Thiodiazotropha lotti]|nr:GTP cyclohydrolase, FolE2/MptA family [Candidatus Thiodiazotropha lotti]
MLDKTPVNGSQIADVQNSADTRQIAINKVGIKDISHPMRIRDRACPYSHHSTLVVLSLPRQPS